jgi:hypothetical protein
VDTGRNDNKKTKESKDETDETHSKMQFVKSIEEMEII